MKTRKIPENPSQRMLQGVEKCRKIRIEDLPVVAGELVLNCMLHAAAPPQEMLRKGVETLALAQALTKMGACVGIVVYLVSDPELTAPPIAHYVLKRPSTPLDLSKVAVEYSEIPLVRIGMTRV